MKPRKGTNQLSKARPSRSLKSHSANSARRGEMKANRTTKQPIGRPYRLGSAAIDYGRARSQLNA
jgi:hypothetical protein